MIFKPLPPSPLRSAGPGLQESLHHYALRIAAQCCMSIRKLEKFLLRDDPRAPKAGNAAFPSSWIGPRSNFRSLLKALQRDTGVGNLHNGTFHAIADVVGRGGTRRRQIRGEGRVWCPVCYLEWEDASSCEPLIWAFEMLSACAVHGVQLESRCHVCAASQAFSVGYRERRFCEQCGSALGHRNGTEELDRQALWVNSTLLKFTSWIEEVDVPITNANFLAFLTAMSNRRGTEESLPPVIKAYVKWELDKAVKELSLPTLATLLNFAAYQGVALQDILCEPTFAASGHMVPSADRFDGLLFRRRDLQLSHRRVVYVISKLTASNGPVPPPSVVWAELGLWCNGVRGYCPHEHQAYRERFLAQKALMGLDRFKRAATSCMRLLESPISASKQKVCLREHLRTNYGLDDAGSSHCANACVNLREALVLSADEEELIRFEKHRIRRAERWVASAEPP